MDIFIKWSVGLLIGATWSTIDFLLILHILKIALLQKDKAKLFIMLLVKFPVLYLGGFLILILKIFPVLSLILGASVALLVVGVIKIWRKPT